MRIVAFPKLHSYPLCTPFNHRISRLSVLENASITPHIRAFALGKYPLRKNLHTVARSRCGIAFWGYLWGKGARNKNGGKQLTYMEQFPTAEAYVLHQITRNRGSQNCISKADLIRLAEENHVPVSNLWSKSEIAAFLMVRSAWRN